MAGTAPGVRGLQGRWDPEGGGSGGPGEGVSGAAPGGARARCWGGGSAGPGLRACGSPRPLGRVGRRRGRPHPPGRAVRASRESPRARGRGARELPGPARAARCGPAAEQRREEAAPASARRHGAGAGGTAPLRPKTLPPLPPWPRPPRPSAPEPPRAGWGRAGPGGLHCLLSRPPCPRRSARGPLAPPGAAGRGRPFPGLSPAPEGGRGREGSGERSLSANKENLSGRCGGDAPAVSAAAAGEDRVAFHAIVAFFSKVLA